MFCQRCGTALAAAGTACSSCSAPIVSSLAAPVSATVVDTVKAASRDALATLKSFAGDPVGRLAPACEKLGDAKAQRTGIAFGIFSVVCFLLGGYLTLPAFVRHDLSDFLGFQGVVKCLGFAVVPFLVTTFAGLGLRKVLGGEGTAGRDAFIAGAALLPVSFGMVLNGILGLENAQMIFVVSVLAGCAGILMLFAGFTRISKLSERAGTLAVPIVVLLTLWLAKVLATSVLNGSGPSGAPEGFPFR